MTSVAESLLRQCSEAAKQGADFPTVWHDVLKPNPAVIGAPVQRLSGEVALLEIALLGGQRILFGPGRTDYRLG